MNGNRRAILASAIAACAVIAGPAIGLVDPHGAAGSLAWSVAVGGVLWGLGGTVARVARISLGLGEQLFVGAIAWIAAVGALLAIGIASRLPLMIVAAAGIALALRELVQRARAPQDRPAAVGADRVSRLVLGGLLVAYLTLNLLGGIASHGNPFDDHAAYLGFTRRLLDCGNLIEPFSLRRISAYGGQTALHALAALRGDVEACDLLDRGIFQSISVLLILDLARARRLHAGATAVIVVFVASLSDLSINVAPTWTGLAAFLAAYSLASDPDRPRAASLVLACAACAAACTLRQNFLLPAGLFVVLLLVSALRSRARESSWRVAWAEQRATAALCVAAALVVVLPYAIAVWRSSATFLYPLWLGTANPAAPLQASGFTALDELRFWFSILLDTEPIRIWWVLAPFMVLARDARPARPWPALAIACAVGFGFMIHSFTLADAPNLWRYGFGYMTALAIVFIVEITSQMSLLVRGESAESRVTLPAIAVFVVWLAMLAQLVQARPAPEQRIAELADNAKAAIALGTAKPGDAELYRELQAAIPEHSRLAVLVDDVFRLDYARNEIISLDLPGFAGPAPGLPSFLGAERWRGYLAAQHIRYVAYVQSDYSSYLFRRRAWVPRIFTETELFRFMGAHMVDAFDTLDELARTSRVVFRRGGLIAIDLGEGARPTEPVSDEPEIARQDRFIRQLSETELHSAAWQLTSRADVSFQLDGHGPSLVQLEAPETDSEASAAFERLFGKRAPAPAHRWLSDRTHVRVLGHGRHRLHIALRVDAARLASIPSASLLLDGQLLGRATADDRGDLGFDRTVSCTGWCDLYLVFSTVSEYWAPAEAVRAIKLTGFEWVREAR